MVETATSPVSAAYAAAPAANPADAPPIAPPTEPRVPPTLPPTDAAPIPAKPATGPSADVLKFRIAAIEQGTNLHWQFADGLLLRGRYAVG
jgi:hypothetical protein